MRWNRAAGARRWCTVLAGGCCVVLAGGQASAAGAQVRLTYTVAQARGITVEVPVADEPGSVRLASSGAPSRVTIEVEGASSVALTAGDTLQVLRPGETAVALGDAPIRYRVLEESPDTAVTFTAAAG